MIYLYSYEKERFTPLAISIVKSYNGSVSFYKGEDSAIVFYTERCIPIFHDPDKIPPGLVITKKEHTDKYLTANLFWLPKTLKESTPF